MLTPNHNFNDKDTLMDALYQFQSAQITDAMAVISRPIADEVDDINEADELIAEALLQAYDSFDIKHENEVFNFYGMKNGEATLLQTLDDYE